MKKNLWKKIMAGADLLALALVIQTVNSACIWNYHQPEIPEDALRFRK